MTRRLILGVGAVGILLICTGVGPVEADDADKAQKPAEKIDPTSVNAACYICHMTFVHEQISKMHFKEKVTCIECHGLSAAHANDEDVGATRPDVVYRRRQVDGMCVECHPSHDVPAREVLARLIQRRLSPKSLAVCTDCHGSHKIEQPTGADWGQAVNSSTTRFLLFLPVSNEFQALAKSQGVATEAFSKSRISFGRTRNSKRCSAANSGATAGQNGGQ